MRRTDSTLSRRSGPPVHEAPASSPAPASAGERLGPAEVLPETDIRALLATFSRRAPTGIRNRALIVLLWRSGLRVSEALALALRDVRLDGERPSLTVRDGKGGAQRVVGVHAEAAAEIERWIAARERRGLGRYRLLFCTLQGGPLDGSYVRRMMREKAARAGLARRVHPHGLRATLAVELAREGVELPAIRDVLGHSNIASTDAYLRRVFPERAVAAVIERGAADPRKQLAAAVGELDAETAKRLLAALGDAAGARGGR